VRQQYQITLKEYLVRGMFRKSVNPLREVRALSDICCDLQPGDRLGIVGANGAGKSTLLKLLAGIYQPTTGRRRVVGRISSLFELALGFEMEASGRQNILYRGYLQGETPRTIRAKLNEIAEFSELGDFLDTPVRYYSAGMMVRLAFSIATAIEPEILLVDEVLGAGDLAFQQKARQRMQEMMAKAQIIVVVSHDLDSLQRLCERGMWLDHGRMMSEGPMAEVVEAYTEHVEGGRLVAA
jgi:ABC-type polysaccharide/polyol phosphate transport system ATPase subunit